MKTAGFLQKDSIATQLIKIVFAWYCIIAILVTTTQVVLEYRHTQSQISDELAINQQIFEPVLSVGLWNLDQEQLQNTLGGMLAVPIISGVKIEQNKTLVIAGGTVIDHQGQIRFYDQQGQQDQLQNTPELLSHTFTVNYVFRDQPREVGEVTVYSDSQVIMSRVELGIVLLIINSVIKTIALWLLFYYIGRRILLRPLGNLIEALSKVDLKSVDTLQINLQSNRNNELSVIQETFEQMQGKLIQARNQIMDLNANLEEKVTRRTLALNLAKEEAELANQAKSVFMSRISHELRTPLNAVIGCSEILEHQLQGEQFKQERNYLGHIKDAGNHLLMLFEDIMDVVVQDGKELNIPLDNCNLYDIVQAGMTMVRKQAEQSQISIENKVDFLYVYGNADRLKQVVVNLLSNGIKYNRENGQIVITTGKPDEHHVQLKIRDTGVGIKAEEQQAIFEPLSRLSYAEQNAIDGTGIGLSIVKNLVEKMNGKVSLDSTPGVGSEFIITLPAAIRNHRDNDLDGI